MRERWVHASGCTRCGLGTVPRPRCHTVSNRNEAVGNEKNKEVESRG